MWRDGFGKGKPGDKWRIQPINFHDRQGCPILLLESQHPADFSSNQLQHAFLELSTESEVLN